MKKEENKTTLDENFFKAMNYELAGEIGAIDNEDMINNRKLISDNDKKSQTKKKK